MLDVIMMAMYACNQQTKKENRHSKGMVHGHTTEEF